MKSLHARHSKRVISIGLLVVLLSGILSVAGAFNTPESGYTICVDKKTKALSFPGTEKCKKGQSKLILGAQGVAGPAGAKGDTGPSEIWLSPNDLYSSQIQLTHSSVSLARINPGTWYQYVVKISDSSENFNMAQAYVSLPAQWRDSGNVYATVYWSAEKTDGNIKMSIGYNGLSLNQVPGGAGFTDSSECSNTNPSTAMVLYSCSYRISEVIYKSDEVSIISVNRWGFIDGQTKNPDTNTGDLYIYGIKLELRN